MHALRELDACTEGAAMQSARTEGAAMQSACTEGARCMH